MLIFPAIDLYEGRAVRLYKGDYAKMTVYSENPVAVARDFASQGARQMHTVDLEGARDGGTPNLGIIERIAKETGLFVECGGGLRDMAAIDRAFAAGVGRVILGTAAVSDERLLAESVQKYGEKIAVGADLRDGRVAIRGWREDSGLTAEDFLRKVEALGVRTGTGPCAAPTRSSMNACSASSGSSSSPRAGFRAWRTWRGCARWASTGP